MKRNFGLVLISAVAALLIGGCSIDGQQTGTVVGDAGSGQSTPWEIEFNRGKENLASGFYGLALERFQSALALNPHSDRVLNAVAVTYDRLGRDDMAKLYYDRALAIEPNSAITLNNVGYSLLRHERYEEALIYFERALKHEPVLADRRVTSANRQLAMDRLRVARQRENRQVIAKASWNGTPEAGRVACADAGSASIGRMGERVFELVTNPTNDAAAPSPYRSGHGSGTVGPEVPSLPCHLSRQGRVAVLNTTGHETELQVAAADNDRAMILPGATARAAVALLNSVPPVTASRSRPVRAATPEGHPLQALLQDARPAPSQAAAAAPEGKAAVEKQAGPVELRRASKQVEKGPPEKVKVSAAAETVTKPASSTTTRAATAPRAIEPQSASPGASRLTVVSATAPIAVADSGRAVESAKMKPRVVSPTVNPAGLIIEVSNGAGRNKLAARMRTYLEAKGLPVSFLTNAESFRFQHTKIFYKSGNRSVAERFAQQLPIAVQFIEVSGYFSDVRILLGADILNFDSATLFAAKAGGSNA